MIELRELQLSGVILMTMFAFALAKLLPKRLSDDKVINRSRWLMVSGLSLFAIQFLLQYIGGFRMMGVVQALIFNIIFFIPASALLSLAGLNLLRQGNLNKCQRFIVLIIWLLATTTILWAVFTDGQPFPAISERLQWAEIIGSILFGIMQIYYSYQLINEIKHTQLAMDNYFDYERGVLIYWIRISVITLTVLALTAPFLIFTSGWPFILYCLFFFATIFYTWFGFVRFIITNEAKSVQDANQNAQEEEKEKKEMKNDKSHNMETLDKVGKAVERWLANGGHLQNGITSPVASAEMEIPRYLLTAWIKAMGHTSFTHWIMNLRIEEAKRMLLEHPNWSNEAVADHCGFTRTHFQKTFKKVTGLSPNKFISVHLDDIKKDNVE